MLAFNTFTTSTRHPNTADLNALITAFYSRYHQVMRSTDLEANDPAFLDNEIKLKISSIANSWFEYSCPGAQTRMPKLVWEEEEIKALVPSQVEWTVSDLDVTTDLGTDIL